MKECLKDVQQKSANFLNTNAYNSHVIILQIPLRPKANCTPAGREMLQQAEDPVTLNQTQIVRHQTSPENTLRLFSPRQIAVICEIVVIKLPTP